MLRVFATDNHYYTLAADDLAMLTARFDRGAYFHGLPSSPYDRIEYNRKKIDADFTEKKGNQDRKVSHPFSSLYLTGTRHVMRPRVRS